MDYLPLVFLVVVVAGVLFLLRYMARLKRAALQTLAEARKVEAELQKLQATTDSLRATAEARNRPADPAPPSGDDPSPG